MSSTDTLAIPAADTPEGALWREILAHDDTNAAAIPAGDGGMLMGGNALSPPDLVGLVNQSDTNEGTEERTNTRVGVNAFFSLIRATSNGRAVCAEDLKEQIDKHRHLAADEQELSRWVLYNLMVYTIALWGTSNNDTEIHSDIGAASNVLAALRADIKN